MQRWVLFAAVLTVRNSKNMRFRAIHYRYCLFLRYFFQQLFTGRWVLFAAVLTRWVLFAAVLTVLLFLRYFFQQLFTGYCAPFQRLDGRPPSLPIQMATLASPRVGTTLHNNPLNDTQLSFPSQPPSMLIRDTHVYSVMAWFLGVRSQ
ncbi:hypothetical protein DVH24_014052 [Malus domestica]|uniref:Uncharacterized protein n=1 Tax=Malus domestica TaxID=3750 RepID=A0A498JEC3_MALDO|nr:hypothetical protein DVH24_014052 [Malus domestica]